MISEPPWSFSELMNAIRSTSATFLSLTQTFEAERRKFHSENSECTEKEITDPNKVVISLERDFNSDYKVSTLKRLTCLYHIIFWHTDPHNQPDPISYKTLNQVVRVPDLQITHQVPHPLPVQPQQHPQDPLDLLPHRSRRPIRERLQPHPVKRRKKQQKFLGYAHNPPPRRKWSPPPRYSPTSPGYYSTPRRYSPSAPSYSDSPRRRSPSPYPSAARCYTPSPSSQYHPTPRFSTPSPERKRFWKYWAKWILTRFNNMLFILNMNKSFKTSLVKTILNINYPVIYFCLDHYIFVFIVM